jgi:hypothetical protein
LVKGFALVFLLLLISLVLIIALPVAAPGEVEGGRCKGSAVSYSRRVTYQRHVLGVLLPQQLLLQLLLRR